MIILRRLFSKRRNLTPEEERERELRDKVFKNEFPKYNISHYIPSRKDRKDVVKEHFERFDSPNGDMTVKDEINQIEGRGDTKRVKKTVKSLKQGKRGVIHLNHRSPLHIIAHESGHLSLEQNARDDEEKRISKVTKTLNDINYPSEEDTSKLSLDELEKIRDEVLNTGNDIIKREELANLEGGVILHNAGATDKELIDYLRQRNTPEHTGSYREALSQSSNYMNHLIDKKKKEDGNT